MEYPYAHQKQYYHTLLVPGTWEICSLYCHYQGIGRSLYYRPYHKSESTAILYKITIFTFQKHLNSKKQSTITNRSKYTFAIKLDYMVKFELSNLGSIAS